MKTTLEWQRKLQQVADDNGKGELNPVLLPLCADALRQWELVTEELSTRPKLVDEWTDFDKGRTERSRPPEFDMQARLIGIIRQLLKDMGMVDLSVDPLAKLKKRLGMSASAN